MKVIGIVAEYNPFHNGHIYQIEKIKEKYSESIIIAIVSSSFNQRGEAMVMNKWDKTEILLNNKIDIVVELPYPFAVQSADIFASGAINTLNELKIDYLSFGTESCDIESLKSIANLQINNKDFDNKIKEYIKEGISYPTAVNKAIKFYISKEVKMPNDLLAISYIKQILKNLFNISLMPVKRTNDYNDLISNGKIISANNIRNKLINNENISAFVPKETYYVLKNYKHNNNYFNYLKYKILSSTINSIVDISEGLDNKIYESVLKSNNIDELIINIKSKRYTYNKLSRALNHILVNFTKDDATAFNNIKYVRVLGMSQNGKKYLNTIKKDIKVPLITKYKKGIPMLDYELKATSIYSLLANDKSLIEKEYKSHTIIH